MSNNNIFFSLCDPAHLQDMAHVIYVIVTSLNNVKLTPTGTGFDSWLSEIESIMSNPAAVAGRGSITHVIFDMDGLLLGNLVASDLQSQALLDRTTVTIVV